MAEIVTMTSMWFKPKPQLEVKTSDASLRRHLMDKIKQQQIKNEAAPVVSLDDFFKGNEDYGSIGCNLTPAIGPQIFYEQLKALRSRPDVQDILVQISNTNEDDPDSLMWPFSDQIYILTSASGEEVAKWLAPLRPDEVEPAHINARVRTSDLESDVEIYRAWWD
ncbi:MAG: hypothetical protein KY445_06225 [Armatimonadetes bacterium]|nr:hypothetical protein [Armatimonadota bacterium]